MVVEGSRRSVIHKENIIKDGEDQGPHGQIGCKEPILLGDQNQTTWLWLDSNSSETLDPVCLGGADVSALEGKINYRVFIKRIAQQCK